MRTLSKFAAAVAISSAALVGTAQASTTPITVTNGAAAQNLLVLGGTTASYSFDYVGGLLKLLLVDTTPDLQSVNYKLYNPVTSTTLVDTNAPAAAPSVSWSLAAGSYILEITNLGSTQFSSTQISAVPVPGAALLFASGAMGLFGLTKRRKG